MSQTSKILIALLIFAATLLLFIPNKAMSEEQKKPAEIPKITTGQQQITLGAGCFWCVEAVFNRLDGVISATSGYMGGTNPSPNYEDVIRRNTGEVEVVHLIYDPEKISTETILQWFWKAHDPTQADGQGADRGPQYLSRIFTHTQEQQKLAKASMAQAQKKFKKSIATKITPASTFHPAEIYHQNYYRLNGDKNPYCRAVIAPKMNKLNLQNKPDTGK